MEKSEINKLFGAHIKNLRQVRGWSQRDLAAKMGNDYQNISALERGKYTPTLIVLMRLAQSFEIKISELIDPVEQEILK
jgi:transcriptional regulator with XRE-family HTH domain